MNIDTPVTRAQKSFLRAFRQNAAGPTPADWPAPGVLRRWLKDRRFKKALTAVRDAIRFQTDFHLASAAATAARAVQSTLTPATATADADPATLADLSKSLKSLTGLLRLAHLRERFTTPARPTRTPRHSATADNAPSVYEEILDDPERLKAYMLMVASRGDTAYDPFLASFPEELAKVRAKDDQRRHNAPHPDPTTTR